MIGSNPHRVNRWIVNGLVIVGIFILAGWAVTERNARREANTAALRSNCQGQNEIRAVLRTEARESYENRFRNLRILKIKPTKKILTVIDKDFRRKMKRLAYRDCG